MKIFADVRVVELASYVLVPAAGAILAEWGADVVKIEHPQRPDPQRNLVIADMSVNDQPFVPLVEQSNRNKRSVGLDVGSELGRTILCRMLERADVFLTNLLPGSLERLGLGVFDLRAINPSLVIARGSGYGPNGADRDTPGFDGTTYWARGGTADNLTPAAADQPTPMRPALGDLPGATSLAGAIAAALFHRQRTGEATEVDVSLLNVAVWGNSPAISASALRGQPITKTRREDNANPLSLTYRTADDRFVKLSLFQSDRYFGPLCASLGVPELADDPRFTDSSARADNRRACTVALDEVFNRLSLADVEARLAAFDGPWSLVQDTFEVSRDEQVWANGYLTAVDSADGPITIATSPWQFGGVRNPVTPAPAHGADTDAVLLELGLDYDAIIEHKVAGVVL